MERVRGEGEGCSNSSSMQRGWGRQSKGGQRSGWSVGDGDTGYSDGAFRA